MPGLQDDLLRLTGSAGNPFETKGTASTTNTGTGIYVGAERTLGLSLAVTAIAGTSPTLDVRIQDSSDGTTYTNMSPAFAFPQQTTAMRAGATTDTWPGATTAFPKLLLQTAVGRPYIRQANSVGGTVPTVTYAVFVDENVFPSWGGHSL